MGVQLTQLVDGKVIELEDLYDKMVAIDTFNWIYQFLSIIRQYDGTPLKDSKGRTTSHMSGLFYRSIKLMEAGVNLIYVFDGAPPQIKKVGEKRRNVREEAKREWKEALERKDYESAKKYAMRSSTMTDEIIEGSKELLSAMGLPVIQAPSEGEALCSYMCKKKDAYVVATQDYDALLFGSPRFVRNLSISGKKSVPELITLDSVLKKLNFTRDQLISLSIIIGTDYNPGGISGYGPKKALELVKEKKTPEKIFEDLIWDFDATPEDIIDFFKNPPVCKYQLKWSKPNVEKIKNIMCDRHEFSEERIDNALKRLQENKPSQKTLGKWIK